MGLETIIVGVLAAAGTAAYSAEQQRKAARKSRKALELSIPEPPDLEKAAPDIDQAKLARQRRGVESLRRGRRSLRIDIPTRNPGLAGTSTTGIRIPS